MMQREFSDSQRSTMGSLTALGGSLCFALVSPLLGWLADVYGVRSALIIATVVGASSLIFYWLAFRHTSASTPQEVPPALSAIE
jgi:MFS family permease